MNQKTLGTLGIPPKESFVLAVLSKLDRQMFCLMWGPTIAAVSVVLDHASDPALVRKALDGLLTAAKIASFHHVDEVMDSLVVSLSKFTSILDPGTPKPALAFGENEKVRMATQTMFTLANRSVTRIFLPLPEPAFV